MAFRSGYDTTDHIQVVKQMMEICNEYVKPLIKYDFCRIWKSTWLYEHYIFENHLNSHGIINHIQTP